MSRHGFMLGLGLITVGGKSKKKRPQGGGPEAASVREAVHRDGSPELRLNLLLSG